MVTDRVIGIRTIAQEDEDGDDEEDEEDEDDEEGDDEGGDRRRDRHENYLRSIAQEDQRWVMSLD